MPCGRYRKFLVSITSQGFTGRPAPARPSRTAHTAFRCHALKQTFVQVIMKIRICIFEKKRIYGELRY